MDLLALHGFGAGFQLWLSAFREEGQGIFQGIYRTEPPEFGSRYEFYTLTFGGGYFLCQAMFGRFLRPRTDVWPGLAQGRYWDRFAIPVWPFYGGSVSWPPPKQFSEHDGRVDFALRWDEIKPPDFV